MTGTEELQKFTTGVANAIREKVGIEGEINPQDFATAIYSISTDSGTVASVLVSDVNFYDYDGTILYSYTKEQFLELSAMPELPIREGLICQGWNWDFDEAKSYVTDYGMLNIGTMYITDDGDTRLYIRIASEGRMTVPLHWYQTVSNGVGIDWGDGSDIQIFTGTGSKNTTHTYAEPGDYVIRLKVTSGTLGLGHGSSSYCVIGSVNDNGIVYCNMLQKVEIGGNVTYLNAYAFKFCYSLASVTIPNSVTSIGAYAFYYCYSLASVTIPNSVTSIGRYTFCDCQSLASVTIPNSVTSIGDYAFYICYSLASVSIPNSVTSIGDYAFLSCSFASVFIPDSTTSIGKYAFGGLHSLASVSIPNSVTSINDGIFNMCSSLASVSIPNSVTSIGKYAFSGCKSLASITIPNNVTSISDYAFSYCNGMAIYDFTSHTSIPTLSDVNAFQSIPLDCVIKVPESLLEEWKAATNWSTYVDEIVAG